MNLTPEQERAATADCSVAVTAGAGTGKTRMLAHRFLHHVAVDKMSPLSIVAVTFTEKAADELRSRIRATVTDAVRRGFCEIGEDHLAEVETAQISTIHALAARICRDFSYLVGIPSDFSIMDETESKIWMSQKLEAAMSDLDPEIVRVFGYTWLLDALRSLLSDTSAANEAFNCDTSNWKQTVESFAANALGGFVRSDAFQIARAFVDEIRGDEDDRLEIARRQAAASITSIIDGKDIPAAMKTLTKLEAHLGKATAWPPNGKAEMGACLKVLKETARRFEPDATLEFGSNDQKLIELCADLRTAFSSVSETLRSEKLNAKLLDYQDLELYALQVLKHDEAVKYYCERWHAFLIDEFQDTNPVQAELLKRLTGNARKTIVGDEKQSIYGFRRADVEGLARFRSEIAQNGGQVERLVRTFRSHTALVENANTIFESLLAELHQPLFSERETQTGEFAPIELSVVADSELQKASLQVIEARHIAKRIKKMLDEGFEVHDGDKGLRPVQPKDFVILSRTWDPLEVYLDALSAEGIPAVHAGGGSLLDTREFKDAYCLLRSLSDPNDDVALVALLRSPFFAISDRVLFSIARKMQTGQSWWSALAAEKGEVESVFGTLNVLLHRRRNLNAVDLLLAADELTGYRAVIGNLAHGGRRDADWQSTIDLLMKLERRGLSDVFAAVRELKTLVESEIEIPRMPLDSSSAVSLMTIHRSKGLEWPVVFVADLARDAKRNTSILKIDPKVGVAFKLDEDGEAVEPAIYTLISKKLAESETAEAKRLLYVAITRAADRVVLTATADKGFYLEMLKPGLAAANIESTPIPCESAMSILPASPNILRSTLPTETIIEPITASMTRLPATGLSVYQECPRKFKFRFIDGHPGLGDVRAVASNIGTLTHRALEFGFTAASELAPFSAAATGHEVEEALGLADRFRDLRVYSTVRVDDCEREKKFVHEIDGLKLVGTVDVVGPDFVLDYKTDAEIYPAAHRFQLWLYAKAFQKSKAYIAYLRKDVLHAFSAKEIAATETDAKSMISKIRKGEHPATPSHEICHRCNYAEVCESRWAV